MESALGPRARRPALQESLRSWAGSDAPPPNFVAGQQRGDAQAPLPRGRPAAEFGGRAREKGRPFVCGRCAARLRGSSGRGQAGGHICSTLRGTGRRVPKLQKCGPRRRPHRLRGVGWGRTPCLPLPPPRTTVLPLSKVASGPQSAVTPWKYLTSPRSMFQPPQVCFKIGFSHPPRRSAVSYSSKKRQFHTPSKKRKTSRGGCAGASVSHPSPVGKTKRGFSASEVGSPSPPNPSALVAPAGFCLPPSSPLGGPGETLEGPRCLTVGRGPVLSSWVWDECLSRWIPPHSRMGH